MTLHSAVDVVALVVDVGFGVWIVRLRRQIKRRKEEDAAEAARALGSVVLVAGVELPLPEDERWAPMTYTLVNTKALIDVLAIGVVKVGGAVELGHNRVWIDKHPLEPDGPSIEQQDYADDVWNKYRTRIVRKYSGGST